MNKGTGVIALFGAVALGGGIWTGLLQNVVVNGSEACGTPWIPHLPESAPFVTTPTAEQCAYMATGPAISAAASVMSGLMMIFLAIFLDYVVIKIKT